MRFALIRRGKAEEPPGIVGVARVDVRTKVLVKRIEPGDIAIIDHPDLDRVSADELIASRVAAVVNTAKSITGRYPNLGPRLLLDAGNTALKWALARPGDPRELAHVGKRQIGLALGRCCVWRHPWRIGRSAAGGLAPLNNGLRHCFRFLCRSAHQTEDSRENLGRRGDEHDPHLGVALARLRDDGARDVAHDGTARVDVGVDAGGDAVAQIVRVPGEREGAGTGGALERVRVHGVVRLARGRAGNDAAREHDGRIVAECRAGQVEQRVLASPARADHEHEASRADPRHATRRPSRHTMRAVEAPARL